MRKEERLTKKVQYEAVYHKGRAQVSKLLVMRTLPSGLEKTRYGFSVSKRVGNAVIRNRVKRRLREILRLTPTKPGWDVVFVARPATASTNYYQLKAVVEELLARGRLLGGGE